MLIDEPTVLVPRRLAEPLLVLAIAEAKRREVRGVKLSLEMRGLLSDIARAARCEIDSVPHVSVDGSARFRGPIINGVTTKTAGERLGISERAVRYRIAAGSLRAERGADGAWLVELVELPEEG